MLHQRNTRWQPDTTAPWNAVLSGAATHGTIPTPPDATAGFTIIIDSALAATPPDGILLAIPDVLQIVVRQHDPRDRTVQNYPAFPLPDGSVPVLEATLLLYPADATTPDAYTIGVPLACLPQHTQLRQITLHFSGVEWSLYIDDIRYDQDFPLGYPRWPQSAAWQRDPLRIASARLWVPALPVQALAAAETTAQVQYWTPPSHNAWVGDVVTMMHNGRFHLFYLFDRRHHQSKKGRGAHYFEHLSTTDFRSWTMHDAATPLTAQWECIGTGTPFVDNDGRLCLAYALHTERVCADDQTTVPAQLEWLTRHGETGTFDQTTPGIPIGSTYAISADGVSDFHKTRRFFHPCRNPSIYRDHTGALRMLANYSGASAADWGKGTWGADHVDGGWRCLNPDFPPGGDCTFAFHWGAYDYVIGGFVHLWMKPIDAPETAFVDLVSSGKDCYDGLSVPSVCQISPERFVMAGWYGIRGWGGVLVIRELLQRADGSLGTRWLPELIPPTGPVLPLQPDHPSASRIDLAGPSFVWAGTVVPQNEKSGSLRVAFFTTPDATSSSHWELDIGAARAAFATGDVDTAAPRPRSLREGTNPAQCADYAIEHCLEGSGSFRLRILVLHNAKLGGSLIDVEIADTRTMVSFRPDVVFTSLRLTGDAVTCVDQTIAAISG